MTGIYQIVNTRTGKRYIGSAVDIGRRRKSHWDSLRRGTHHAVPLQRAWHKYGAAAFVCTPLLRCAARDLLFFEQRCLDAWRPAYNVAPTAGSPLGTKHSAESLANMAAAQQNRSPEWRAKVAAANRIRSPESRAKIGAANRNPSLETRAKIGAAARNRSPETRAKLSAAARNVSVAGRIRSPESRAKISVAARNRSPEWRAKLSAAARNPSPETRAKISAAARNRSRRAD